jgi:hypothetical protein
MHRRRGWWVVGAFAALAGAVGCHTIKNETEVPLVEEFRAPPDEDRFNNPPEQGYRKPPPKQEFKPGFGGPGGGGGGMGGGGMGMGGGSGGMPSR